MLLALETNPRRDGAETQHLEKIDGNVLMEPYLAPGCTLVKITNFLYFECGTKNLQMGVNLLLFGTGYLAEVP